MHEYRIARDLVRQAVAEAERWGVVRITALRIGVEAAQSIQREAFIFSIQAAAAGTVAEGAKVEFKESSERGIVLESMEVEEAN